MVGFLWCSQPLFSPVLKNKNKHNIIEYLFWSIIINRFNVTSFLTTDNNNYGKSLLYISIYNELKYVWDLYLLQKTQTFRLLDIYNNYINEKNEIIMITHKLQTKQYQYPYRYPYPNYDNTQTSDFFSDALIALILLPELDSRLFSPLLASPLFWCPDPSSFSPPSSSSSSSSSSSASLSESKRASIPLAIREPTSWPRFFKLSYCSRALSLQKANTLCWLLVFVFEKLYHSVDKYCTVSALWW